MLRVQEAQVGELSICPSGFADACDVVESDPQRGEVKLLDLDHVVPFWRGLRAGCGVGDLCLFARGRSD